MKHATRILLPALFLCLAAALLTWLTVQPDHQLVGLRPLPPRASEFPELTPPPLAATLATLESVSLWGLQRNGQALAPPSPKVAVEEVAIVWKVLGAALRKKERYLLIQIENKAPAQIKEGEELPDGNTLVKILAQGYILKTPEGKTETVLTNP